jgi:hypothetical protein
VKTTSKIRFALAAALTFVFAAFVDPPANRGADKVVSASETCLASDAAGPNRPLHSHEGRDCLACSPCCRAVAIFTADCGASFVVRFMEDAAWSNTQIADPHPARDASRLATGPPSFS